MVSNQEQVIMVPIRYIIQNSNRKVGQFSDVSNSMNNEAAFFSDYDKVSIWATEDGRSMSVFSLYWQLSQSRMANFPAFKASKSFDL